MGTKVLGFYLVFFYFFPYILYFMVGPHRNFYYFEFGLNYYVFIIIFFSSWWFFSLTITNKIILWKRFFNPFQYHNFWLMLAILCIPLGLYFFFNFGLEYRQSGSKISDSGLVPKLIFMFKPAVFSYLFYDFFTCELYKSWKVFWIKALFLIFLVLTLFAAFEALIIIFLLISIFSPKLFYSLLTLPKFISFTKYFAIFLGVVIFGFIGVSGIIIVGIANKRGIDGAVDYFLSNDVVGTLSYYMYYRISVFHSSFSLYAYSTYFNFDYYYSSFNILWDAFIYRVGLVFGFDVSRPELTNLNRLNYIFTHRFAQAKEIGSSPGVFGAFSMFVPLHFAAMLSGVYFASFSKLLNKIKPIANNRQYSLIAVFLLFYFFFPFLHNPFHSALTLGPESFKFLLYLITLVAIVKARDKDRRKNDSFFS